MFWEQTELHENCYMEVRLRSSLLGWLYPPCLPQTHHFPGMFCSLPAMSSLEHLTVFESETHFFWYVRQKMKFIHCHLSTPFCFLIKMFTGQTFMRGASSAHFIVLFKYQFHYQALFSPNTLIWVLQGTLWLTQFFFFKASLSLIHTWKHWDTKNDIA